MCSRRFAISDANALRTSDCEIPNCRAILEGVTPALKAARTAFNFPCVKGTAAATSTRCLREISVESFLPRRFCSAMTADSNCSSSWSSSCLTAFGKSAGTNGSTWDQHREAVANLIIETVEAYAPGFKASVIARQSLSPLDLHRIFGLPNGDIFHGAMTPDQLFSARPMLGSADYRMPVAGLYLCGSGAHPGGGVTGAPWHNAAQAVIADLLRK